TSLLCRRCFVDRYDLVRKRRLLASSLLEQWSEPFVGQALCGPLRAQPAEDRHGDRQVASFVGMDEVVGDVEIMAQVPPSLEHVLNRGAGEQKSAVQLLGELLD